MDSSFNDWKAVKVTNCRVLKEQDRGDVHIFLNNHSQIANLLHKFQIPDHFYAASRPVRISAIESLSDMAKVKVVNVESLKKIKAHFGKEILKQDYPVGYSSACCNQVALEKDINSLTVTK